MGTSPSDPSREVAMGRSRAAAGGLSTALREEASRRVAWTSLSAAGLFAAYHLLQHLTNTGPAGALDDPINRLITLATVLLAGGLFALHHFRVLPPSTVLPLGTACAVLIAGAVSLIETWAFTAGAVAAGDAPGAGGLLPGGVSAVGPWIVFVGAFVPNRPTVTLAMALLAASTWPAAYLVNAARFGLLEAPHGIAFVWSAINYLMAGAAYLASRWTYGRAPESAPSDSLGSYRLVSPLGEGGMGEVWAATHQLLARSAAIKLVRPEAIVGSSAREADAFVKRFRREANAIAGLQSPHTVYLYDFGVAEDGRLYYVMELLDGISLQTLVSRFGPQPAPRVSALLQQVCASLDEAHAEGLVHRDLKPSNIMLCRVARTYDFVKVLDFGLAKSVAHGDQTQLTIAGTVTGTPGYMAPEVLMGDPSVDGRADIYAVGCVAYLLLTGTPVFQDPNPTTLAFMHVQTPPEPPSARTELRIASDLETLVLQCLAKRPAERPASAQELRDRLAACERPRWGAADAAHWWEVHLPPTSSLRAPARPPVTAPDLVRKA
jgi:serine/threonine-protein kinase